MYPELEHPRVVVPPLTFMCVYARSAIFAHYTPSGNFLALTGVRCGEISQSS